MKTPLWLLAVPLSLLPPRAGGSAFEVALSSAERSLAAGDLDKAHHFVIRALERDAKSPRAWELRARWAEAAGERDEQVFALHRELRLLETQKAAKSEIAALRERLLLADPVATEMLGMRSRFIEKLSEVAKAYEKDKRPHSAIRVLKEVQALDPENLECAATIQKLASLPDPSLAADAKPVDLLADVSEEWMREFDQEHVEWSSHAKLERDNYTTHTNAGYAVLVRSAEAMEQMNAFYRRFFQYHEDGGAVGRIDLNLFKSRDEYLKLGMGPPVEWSGGHFTGSAVETYVEGGFENMVGTLFHEAAHQFVSLATNASGWLNEGLASFFEGCRILPNGTVLMNMPANHRLFPLADRMEKGWMTDERDGMNPDKLSDSDPPKAPTFAIVLENKYEWGPPWYAPTWGVVYFLYNYQDPLDGRYVYRKAFGEFIDKSGGRVGSGAIKNFEEVVLANPQPPIQGVPRPEAQPALRLPRTVAELDPVWKDWILGLRDEQRGVLAPERPWLRWARAAAQNGDLEVAEEHFEKGLVASPNDVELLSEFAEFLAERDNTDRATKLSLAAMRELEQRDPPDLASVRAIERKLEKWDKKLSTLEKVHAELWGAAKALVQRYRDESLPLMVMDVAWRMEVELGVPGLFEYYAEAQKKCGKTLSTWSLAYNENDLEGWDAGQEQVFRAAGPILEGANGQYKPDEYLYKMLGLEELTAGDFSMEAEVQAERGDVGFCGLIFGRKDANNFHALILFPPKPKELLREGVAETGFVDLASFYGAVPKVWRHNPVESKAKEGESTTGTWRKLRIDVSGKLVDAWVDGQYMATQEFPTADVLRGTFGLILGPGKARFREIRFVSRHPRDPAAALERERRMQAVEEGGGSVGGSWLGKVPPFPTGGRWVQGPRESWAEKGPVPQLLVLWSIQQNDIVRIDRWLQDLAQQHAAAGLEIVSVASPNDEEKIGAYIGDHPFPGSLAVDFREGVGMGDTNVMYSTLRFNLPRLLLLDIDGRVVWEGDPGFSAAEPYSPGVESYLDTPLAELIARRKVRELKAWVEAWRTKAAPALHEGDVQSALDVLKQSRGFERDLVLEVRAAQRALDALESAINDLEETTKALADEGRGPALKVLLAWADGVGMAVERRARAAAQKEAAGATSKAWDRALKQLEGRGPKAQKDPAVLAELIESINGLEGAFPAELAVRLAAVASDPAAMQALLEEAPSAPRLWLARTWFNW